MPKLTEYTAIICFREGLLHGEQPAADRPGASAGEAGGQQPSPGPAVRQSGSRAQCARGRAAQPSAGRWGYSTTEGWGSARPALRVSQPSCVSSAAFGTAGSAPPRAPGGPRGGRGAAAFSQPCCRCLRSAALLQCVGLRR